MTSNRILIVDDDPQIRDILRISLVQAGFDVIEAANGVQALSRVTNDMPSLVVLDIGMPEMDGLAVCRDVRKDNDVPILFLTAHADEVDRILGLEMGGDDYVTKPFSPRELTARIKAILKRTTGRTMSNVLRHGVIELDQDRHLCRVKGQSLTLTSREMDILGRLMANPEHVVSRPRLVDAVYGTNIHVSDRTLDSHLRNLRAKLTEAGCDDAIDTLHGVGIRMGACTGQPCQSA